jgi:hypothetical protein
MKFIDHTGLPLEDLEKYEHIEVVVNHALVPEDAVVLELGGRLGVVSCTLNRKLTNKSAHVVVEPYDVYVEAIVKNRQTNNCLFEILMGAISEKPMMYIPGDHKELTIQCDSIEDSNITTYKYEDALNLLPPGLKFDHIVADCEGAFEMFLRENIDRVKDWKYVFLEYDCADRCNYKYIEETLKNNGLTKIRSGFHSVFAREPLSQYVKYTPDINVGNM